MNAFLVNLQRSMSSGVNRSTVEAANWLTESLTDSFRRAHNLNSWKYLYVALNWTNIFNMIIMWSLHFTVWRWSIGMKTHTYILFVVLLSTKGKLFCDEDRLTQRGKKDDIWIFMENACWTAQKQFVLFLKIEFYWATPSHWFTHGLWLFAYSVRIESLHWGLSGPIETQTELKNGGEWTELSNPTAVISPDGNQTKPNKPSNQQQSPRIGQCGGSAGKGSLAIWWPEVDARSSSGRRRNLTRRVLQPSHKRYHMRTPSTYNTYLKYNL